MADGSVVVDVDMDVSEAEKELAKLKKEIRETESTITEQEKKKAPLVNQAEKLRQEMKAARAEVEKYRQEWLSGAVGADTQQASAQQRLSQTEAEYEKITSQIGKIDDNLLPSYEKLDGMKVKAGGLEKELNDVRKGAGGLGPALDVADKYMDKFTKRVKGLAKRVFVFTVITAALRKVKEWFVEVAKTNSDTTASIAKLKGALLTLAQPLVGVVIPAFTALVNILTAVVGTIATLMSAMFGTTAEVSAKAAESLYDQTAALKSTGAAAKKASKQLASFDEINKLSANDSQGDKIAPDFAWADGLPNLFQSIADDVLAVAAGLAMWRISTHLPASLALVGSTLSGLILSVGGLMLLWDGLNDAWNNGVDWANMITMIGGAAAVASGLYIALGKTQAGISLLMSGISMVVIGFKDMIQNGMNLQNTLLTIAGIVATGLGIYVLTGNLIPLVIAGIVSIGLAMVELMGNGEMLVNNLKLIFSGFVTFIQGLVTGDINKVLEGLKAMVKGAINVVLTIVGSLVNAIINGINWLIGKINSINISVPEWVPAIGGVSWVPNIPPVKEWQIPQLAQGAVIPPNREFLAVLGDQKSGTNIEAPLATIEQALENVLNRSGGNGAQVTVIVKPAAGLTRYLKYELDKETTRQGSRLVQGGIV